MLPAELDAKGSDAERPVFRSAVDGVKNGTYSGVIVAYLSRAGRDLRLMLDLWDEVEAAGGAVYSARENIDATTASGRLQRNLLASIAQHELEERRDGFDRARAGGVERGIWQRRQVPRGYAKDPVTRRLVPGPDAQLVRRTFEELRGGVPVIQLADRLAMTPSGVRQLVRNRVYLGELKVGQHVNLDAHPPLVARDLFDAVQGNGRSRPPRTRTAPALLAGLVRCASCGHVMTRGGTAKVAVYVCPRDHSGGRCPAPAAITASLLDNYVEPIIRDELRRLAVTSADGQGVERARARRTIAEAELTAYVEAVSVADVGAAAFRAGAKLRRAAVEAADDELRAHLAAQPSGPVITDGAEAWDALEGHERNRLLRALLRCVVVARGGGRGSRTPLPDRVRVIAYGAKLALPVRRGGEASGLVPIILPDLDHPDVLRPAGGEDRP